MVWVGTGEANDRNSSEWGDGVYRSTDGGGNWTNVGLKESRAIARIIVHPAKPEVAYVAAMGNLWKDGATKVNWKRKDVALSRLTPGKIHADSPASMFYIPAHRVLTLKNGWPRPGWQMNQDATARKCVSLDNRKTVIDRRRRADEA